MTRHYSTRDFFRQMPNALLARYLASREALQDLYFTGMKETKIDVLLFWIACDLPRAGCVTLAHRAQARRSSP